MDKLAYYMGYIEKEAVDMKAILNRIKDAYTFKGITGKSEKSKKIIDKLLERIKRASAFEARSVEKEQIKDLGPEMLFSFMRDPSVIKDFSNKPPLTSTRYRKLIDKINKIDSGYKRRGMMDSALAYGIPAAGLTYGASKLMGNDDEEKLGMEKEAIPLYFGKYHRSAMRSMPTFLRNWVRKYNRFVTGKDINKTTQRLYDRLREAAIKTAKSPQDISAINKEYMRAIKDARSDTAHMNKLMVYLGVLPPVLSTGAATALTAAGAAAPYVIPPSSINNAKNN